MFFVFTSGALNLRHVHDLALIGGAGQPVIDDNAASRDRELLAGSNDEYDGGDNYCHWCQPFFQGAPGYVGLLFLDFRGISRTGNFRERISSSLGKSIRRLIPSVCDKEYLSFSTPIFNKAQTFKFIHRPSPLSNRPTVFFLHEIAPVGLNVASA